MKTKLMIAITAVGFLFASCSGSSDGSTQTEAEISTKIEETKALGDKLDELDNEIKAIDNADADANAAIEELDAL